MATKKKKASKTTTAVAKVPKGGELVAVEDSKYAIIRADTSIAEQVHDIGLKQFGLTRLKMPAGGGIVWELPTLGGSDAVKGIEVVIGVVRSHIRQYYMLSFEESEGNAPPDCSSEDAVTGFGIREEGEEEASTQACEDCPLSQWESKEKGSGQACAEKKAIMFFTADTLLPMLLMAPPTSLKAVTQYGQDLMTFGRQYYGVVTSMTLEKVKGPPDYSVLKLEHLRDLSPDEQRRMKEVCSDLKAAFIGASLASAPASTPE